jgi:hypothetical protein
VLSELRASIVDAFTDEDTRTLKIGTVSMLFVLTSYLLVPQPGNPFYLLGVGATVLFIVAMTAVLVLRRSE